MVACARGHSRPAESSAWCAALVAACLVAPVVAQDRALPALPLAEYPTDARAALEPLYKDAAARPDDAAAVGLLARSLHAWQELDAAHQVYSRAQTLAPQTFEWWYLDAVVLQRQARHDEAAIRFRRALELTPDYLPARVKLAESLLKAGNVAESRPLFEALLDDRRGEAFARFGLAQIAALDGRHDAAVPLLQRALAIFPEWGEAYYVLAMSLRALDRRDEAAQALASQARFGPIVPALEDPLLAGITELRNDAVASLARGVALKEAGDLAGAIAAHEAAAARDPSYAQAHSNLISLYAEAGNWAKVEEHYRAALALGFGLANANFDYGVAQERQDKWDAAEAAYRQALTANPEHAAARINLGRLLERRKDFEGAVAEFRLAVASQPTNRVARYDLGRMLLALGKPREAIPEFELALEPRDEKTPASLLGLAVALALAGETDQATRRFDEARALAASYGQTTMVRAIDEAQAAYGGTKP